MKTFILIFTLAAALLAQSTSQPAGSPTGVAGGALSGSYPNPCSATLTCGTVVPTANCTPGTTPDYLNTATATRYYCSATNTWAVGQSVVGNLNVPSGNVGIGAMTSTGSATWKPLYFGTYATNAYGAAQANIVFNSQSYLWGLGQKSSNFTLGLANNQNNGSTITSPYLTVLGSNGNVGIGSANPGAKLTSTGDVFVTTSAAGVILTDSGGACWRIMVAPTTGILSTASVSCPSY